MATSSLTAAFHPGQPGLQFNQTEMWTAGLGGVVVVVEG